MSFFLLEVLYSLHAEVIHPYKFIQRVLPGPKRPHSKVKKYFFSGFYGTEAGT